jgi:hypothetical protein
MSNDNYADMARLTARRRIDSAREALVDDARQIAKSAALLADAMKNGVPSVAAANSLAQSAMQLAIQTASLEGEAGAGKYFDEVIANLTIEE